MTKKAAGEYVVSLRRLADFNQADVVRLTGLSDRQISRIENGESAPSLAGGYRLMKALNGSLDQLAALLVSKKSTIADAMREAANGHAVEELARQIQSEEELEELIRVYRSLPDG